MASSLTPAGAPAGVFCCGQPQAGVRGGQPTMLRGHGLSRGNRWTRRLPEVPSLLRCKLPFRGAGGAEVAGWRST
jgi:hypothetical protein